MYICRAIFLKKIGSRTHSDPKFSQRRGGVSYIDARKKRFQNAGPACVVLRKNFWNGVLVCSITKILLITTDTKSAARTNSPTFLMQAHYLKQLNVI
jgi:hypothetical protein